jgi:hypothetical protein
MGLFIQVGLVCIHSSISFILVLLSMSVFLFISVLIGHISVLFSVAVRVVAVVNYSIYHSYFLISVLLSVVVLFLLPYCPSQRYVS